MKKEKNKPTQFKGAKKQTGVPTKKQDGLPEDKHQPPIKTPATNGRQNTVEESVGLNESRTSSEELLPQD